MRRRGLPILLLIFACWIPGQGKAQDEQPLVRLDYRRQNDFTFSTQLDTWYPFQKDRYSLDLRLNHTNIYNSSLNKDRMVQFYFRSSIWQHYRLARKIDIASWIETDQYLNNRNEKISIYAGLRYTPWSFLKVTPLLGYAWDTRTAFLGRTEPTVRLDQGLSPAIFVESLHTWEDGLQMRTELAARYKQIDPRRQHNVTLRNNWMKSFEEGVVLSAGLRAASHELDDYQANSVKRIISDSLIPEVTIIYEFYPGLQWRSENALMLNRRRFVFNNLVFPDPEENNLTFHGMEASSSQVLSLAKRTTRLSATYEYAYASRQYALENNLNLNQTEFEKRVETEKQKDFVRNQHKIDLFGQTIFRKRQVLEARLVNQYLQYDTPGESNFDDRDELSFVASMKWLSKWSRTFATTLDLNGNHRHYAFLFKEKSQDNYIQRSLRLDFGYAWDVMRKLRVEGEQSVYVTYNVKDFNDYNRTDRSTRNLETNVRAIWRPNSRLQGEAFFRRKETHQSYLNWQAFTETTLDTNRILTMENKYRFFFEGKTKKAVWYLEAGYKHFDQTRRFKANMLSITSELKAISLRQISWQTGPLLAIGFRNTSQSTIDLGVWMQIQLHHNKYRLLETTEIFGTAHQESTLRELRTEFRPYPTLRVNYFLGAKK